MPDANTVEIQPDKMFTDIESTNDQSRVPKNHFPATEIPQANQVEIHVHKKFIDIESTDDGSRAP